MAQAPNPTTTRTTSIPRTKPVPLLSGVLMLVAMMSPVCRAEANAEQIIFVPGQMVNPLHQEIYLEGFNSQCRWITIMGIP